MESNRKRVIDLWIVVGTLLALGVYGTAEGILACLRAKGVTQAILAIPHSPHWLISPIIVFLSVGTLWRKGWARKVLCRAIWLFLLLYLFVAVLMAFQHNTNALLGALAVAFCLYLILIFLQSSQTKELFSCRERKNDITKG